jgi:hypothetical protein
MENQSNKFTVTAKALAQQMESKMNPQENAMVGKVYSAAMKLAFSTHTHFKVMDEIDAELKKHGINNASSVLGSETSHIMQIVYSQAKGLPPAALIPAGVLFLAKLCEFYSKSLSMPMNDKVFSDAAHMLITLLRSKYEPDFYNKIGMPAQASQPDQQAAPQTPGMLSTGGA